jgi:hypothetical protein
MLGAGHALAVQPLAESRVAERRWRTLLPTQGRQAGQRRLTSRLIQAPELLPEPLRSRAPAHTPARLLPGRNPSRQSAQVRSA